MNACFGPSGRQWPCSHVDGGRDLPSAGPFPSSAEREWQRETKDKSRKKKAEIELDGMAASQQRRRWRRRRCNKSRPRRPPSLAAGWNPFHLTLWAGRPECVCVCVIVQPGTVQWRLPSQNTQGGGQAGSALNVTHTHTHTRHPSRGRDFTHLTHGRGGVCVASFSKTRESVLICIHDVSQASVSPLFQS